MHRKFQESCQALDFDYICIFLNVKVVQKKMLVTFHEQKRILQFNNQNLHNVNIGHITDYTNV